jgi:hypothetical protein
MAKKSAAAKSGVAPNAPDPVEFDDNNEPEHVQLSKKDLSAAVVFNTDWTVETVTLQTSNIVLNPNFQRRDAWSIEKKSKFIESLILGLPVPPIILAELKHAKGKFIVIDGKQRLLSILQFWGKNPESPNNSYALRGLDVRDDLIKTNFTRLTTTPECADDYSALRNQPIRTVVIRNWPTDEFLHLVFLRFNTGSVRLSAQELRQALKPGEYTRRVDAYAADNAALRKLFGANKPDPRMRDTEILGRHIAFVNFIESYPGRLKTFLDTSFEELNSDWATWGPTVEQQFEAFDAALEGLIDVFSEKAVARRPGSRLLNKALLDPLLYYFERQDVRAAAKKHGAAFKAAYAEMLKGEEFQKSIGLDTASTDSTVYRFAELGRVISKTCKVNVKVPHKAKGAVGIVLK